MSSFADLRRARPTQQQLFDIGTVDDADAFAAAERTADAELEAFDAQPAANTTTTTTTSTYVSKETAQLTRQGRTPTTPTTTTTTLYYYYYYYNNNNNNNYNYNYNHHDNHVHIRFEGNSAINPSGSWGTNHSHCHASPST